MKTSDAARASATGAGGSEPSVARGDMTVRTASAPACCAAVLRRSPRSWSGSSVTTTTSSSGWMSRHRRTTVWTARSRSLLMVASEYRGSTARVVGSMSRVSVWSMYALLVAIWSSTWVAIKVGLGDTPPLLGAGVRFALAGVGLLVLARLSGRSLRTDAVLAAVLAVLPFAFTYGLIYWSEQYVVRARGGPVRRAADLRRADRVVGVARRAAPGAAVPGGRAGFGRPGGGVLRERRARVEPVRAGRRLRLRRGAARCRDRHGVDEAPRCARRRDGPERMGGVRGRRPAARRVGRLGVLGRRVLDRVGGRVHRVSGGCRDRAGVRDADPPAARAAGGDDVVPLAVAAVRGARLRSADRGRAADCCRASRSLFGGRRNRGGTAARLAARPLAPAGSAHVAS